MILNLYGSHDAFPFSVCIISVTYQSYIGPTNMVLLFQLAYCVHKKWLLCSVLSFVLHFIVHNLHVSLWTIMFAILHTCPHLPHQLLWHTCTHPYMDVHNIHTYCALSYDLFLPSCCQRRFCEQYLCFCEECDTGPVWNPHLGSNQWAPTLNHSKHQTKRERGGGRGDEKVVRWRLFCLLQTLLLYNYGYSAPPPSILHLIICSQQLAFLNVFCLV